MIVCRMSRDSMTQVSENAFQEPRAGLEESHLRHKSDVYPSCPQVRIFRIHLLAITVKTRP